MPFKFSKRAFVAGMATLAIGLGVASAATNTASAQSKEITVAFGVDPTSLNPLASTSIPGRSAIDHIFDKLLWFDTEGNLIPKLALSWEFVEPTVLQFKLRQGVKWHDGTDFTAEDVKFTLDSARQPETPNWMTATFQQISDVKVIDLYTVQVMTPKPNRSLLRSISLVEMVSKHEFTTNPGNVKTKPMGTGPFKFVSYTSGDRLVLEKYPDYWGGAPKIDKLTIRVIPESGTRIAELQAGTVDFIDNVPIDQIGAIESQGDLDLLANPSLRIMYLALRTKRAPFNNPMLRQAVQYAIDKDAIVESLLAGKGSVANTPIAPQIPGSDDQIKAWPYDPAKARALLEQAGAVGTKIIVGYPNGRYLMDKQIGEAIAGYLQAVGFEVEQQSPEWSVYISCSRKGNDCPFDIALNGWGGDTVDPNWVLWNNFHTSTAVIQTGYSDKQVDGLLEKALETLDDGEAMKLYKQIQEIVVPDSSWIPLYFQPNVWAKNKRLQGVSTRPDEFMIFSNGSVQ